MPALKPTDWTCEIVWLGTVTSEDRKELLSEVRDELTLRFDGVEGSVHGGRTRPSCSRVTAQYPKGTEIGNERQLSIVSVEELEVIAEEMGIDAVDPARMGANVVVRGLPDFSHVPPSSRLQAPSGATIVVDMQNRPCQFPARSLKQVVGEHAKGFKTAAKGRRGVTGWVTREGAIRVGDTLILHIPDQRKWKP